MKENKYRVIEIAEGCMGGESEIYLTNAPDNVIKKALKACKNDDTVNPIEVIEKEYEIDLLISSMVTMLYYEKMEVIKVEKSFSIY